MSTNPVRSGSRFLAVSPQYVTIYYDIVRPSTDTAVAPGTRYECRQRKTIIRLFTFYSRFTYVYTKILGLTYEQSWFCTIPYDSNKSDIGTPQLFEVVDVLGCWVAHNKLKHWIWLLFCRDWDLLETWMELEENCAENGLSRFLKSWTIGTKDRDSVTEALSKPIFYI